MENKHRQIFSVWRGSTLQTIAVVVLPLTFLLVVISFGSYFIHQNAMRGMVGERDERAVRAAVGAVQAEIEHRAETMRGMVLLAREPSKSNLERVLVDFAYLADEFDLGLAYVSANRVILASTGSGEFWQALPDYYQMNAISTLMVNDQPVVLVSAGAPDGDVWVVGAFSAVNLLETVLKNDFPSNGNATVYVFNSDYQVLFQRGPGAIEGDPAHHPGIAEALAGKSGATYMQAGSDEHVLAYSAVPATGWAVVIEESWEAVANPTLQTSQITPMILVPALLLAALALWFGAEQIVRPLRSLEAKASRLAWGDFDEIEQPVNGIVEIRHLQAELVHMARQVKAAQQSLHTYIGAITQGQEDERQRLAHELHDDTIQALIALRQHVQLARRALPKDQALPALAELETLTEQTINDLRRTIRALRPIYLEDLGLVAALNMLATETGQNSGLKIDFLVKGQERRLAADVELALYRMAQESLNNIIHHAQASWAALAVEFTPQAVSLRVSDNGIGFVVPKNPAEFAPGGHFGLVGLHERAQLIGAGLDIQSAPGNGTELSIYLPVKAPLAEG